MIYAGTPGLENITRNTFEKSQKEKVLFHITNFYSLWTNNSIIALLKLFQINILNNYACRGCYFKIPIWV